MKKLFLSILLLPTFILSDYLQDGLYPKCSYVIVDEDGWYMHMNQDGKLISMTPKDKHNHKMGKYSFDKFGNLIPYRECTNSPSQKNSNKTKNESSIDIDIEINLFSNLDFSVFAGISSPFGDNTNMYDPAPNFGLESKLGNFIFTLGLSSFEYEEEIESQNNAIFYRKNTLSSMDIIFGYKLNLGKLYFTPSLGMFNRSFEASGAGLESESLSGADPGFSIELGYNFNKFSIYAAGNYTATLYGEKNVFEEKFSTFYNFGLKYNF
tara:strand:+ start:94 stop:891 length:798 start_codon:yes stop_codon:yes gene_type:complete